MRTFTTTLTITVNIWEEGDTDEQLGMEPIIVTQAGKDVTGDILADVWGRGDVTSLDIQKLLVPNKEERERMNWDLILDLGLG